MIYMANRGAKSLKTIPHNFLMENLEISILDGLQKGRKCCKVLNTNFKGKETTTFRSVNENPTYDFDQNDS